MPMVKHKDAGCPKAPRGLARPRIAVAAEPRYLTQAQPAGLAGALCRAGHPATVLDPHDPRTLRCPAWILIARGRSEALLSARTRRVPGHRHHQPARRHPLGDGQGAHGAGPGRGGHPHPADAPRHHCRPRRELHRRRLPHGGEANLRRQRERRSHRPQPRRARGAAVERAQRAGAAAHPLRRFQSQALRCRRRGACLRASPLPSAPMPACSRGPRQ